MAGKNGFYGGRIGQNRAELKGGAALKLPSMVSTTVVTPGAISKETTACLFPSGDSRALVLVSSFVSGMAWVTVSSLIVSVVASNCAVMGGCKVVCQGRSESALAVK